MQAQMSGNSSSKIREAEVLNLPSILEVVDYLTAYLLFIGKRLARALKLRQKVIFIKEMCI